MQKNQYAFQMKVKLNKFWRNFCWIFRVLNFTKLGRILIHPHVSARLFSNCFHHIFFLNKYLIQSLDKMLSGGIIKYFFYAHKNDFWRRILIFDWTIFTKFGSYLFWFIHEHEFYEIYFTARWFCIRLHGDSSMKMHVLRP